jgi:uncharacterized membrane protein
MTRIRDLLADGLMLALPLGAAAFLLYKALELLSKLLLPATYLLPNGRWFGLAAVELAALAVLVLALLALGVFARSTPGRRLAGAIENLVLGKLPFYLIVKNIVADVTSAENTSDMRPALVAFDDHTALGFVVEQSPDCTLLTAFIPSAPGAATGRVVLVPAARVQLVDDDNMNAMRTMKQRGLGLQALRRAATRTAADSGPQPQDIPR